MKIVPRELGESLIIDGHICVTVKAIEDEGVVLSIESSQLEPAYREELISFSADSSVSPMHR